MSNMSVQGNQAGSGASQLTHDEGKLLMDFGKLFTDMSAQKNQQAQGSQGSQGSGDGGGQGAGGASGAGGSQEILQLLMQLLQQLMANQGGGQSQGGDPMQLMGQGNTPA
jgi:hypothetical protein